ncbi:hypothetical protein BCR33DRAFT_261678 [Rhizoclosmatium globosum]|uniref:Uncharacterized protein n=1 Tax=Rhizoclosmatium globosum TaxID=329046 RepID=A0A1Y2C8U1_9FUNG|nr:hypothetical protein BCR33DRAFT_261678 [Rhizoclosmatium globosum]|eukprot:ORY43438.1 hypothetical protein BCR33DRAFT_261678 [Rhizoclosmatium globosum]
MARTYRPIETEDDVPRPKPSYVSTLTIESWFYHIFSAGFLIHMIATTISFSSSTRPEFPNYKRFLRQSWIPNTLFDNSDVQYRGFRAGLLFLIPVSLIHVSLSNALQRWTTTHQSRIHPRIAFSLLFSILYFIVYNGLSGFLKILTVLVLSYTVVKNVAGYKWGPGIVWALGLGMLIGTKHFRVRSKFSPSYKRF